MPFDIKAWRARNRERLIQWNRKRRRDLGAKTRILVTDELIERVSELYREGKRPPEIAKIVHMSITTVYRCIGGIRNPPEELAPLVRVPLYPGCQPVNAVGERYLSCAHYDTALRRAMNENWAGFACPDGCPEFRPEGTGGTMAKGIDKASLTKLRETYQDVVNLISALNSLSKVKTVDGACVSQILEATTKTAAGFKVALDAACDTLEG